MIDQALAIAETSGVMFCSFGDMLRVPGSQKDLLSARASGADVRIVYSPLDAVKLARENPDRNVVFFAVGFETTAPATAMAIEQAHALCVDNFSMLVTHVLVPPALHAILSDPGNRIEGFLAAGHVCAVRGYREYEPICDQYRVPIVVTGFEPVDILSGIRQCLGMLQDGSFTVHNRYTRTVSRDGNRLATATMDNVFQVVDRKWRGIGTIPASGLALRECHARFDAAKRFQVESMVVSEPAECRSGDVLQGRIKPGACAAFGTRCTPEHPLGATMVSGEGACAAYYQYRRMANDKTEDSQ